MIWNMLLEKAKRLIKTISFNCSINLSFLILDISKIADSFNAPTLKGLQWNYNARGRLKVGDQGGVLRSWLTRWLYHLCATGPRLAVGPVHPGEAVFQGSSKMLIQPKIDEGVAGYIGHCQHVTDEENK